MHHIFKKSKHQIDAVLKTYLLSKSRVLRAINPWGPDAIRRLIPFVTSGKGIRGSLLVLSHTMLQGTLTSDAYTCAAAIELIQSGLLIHDDIMDQDTIRRRGDSLYVQYTNHVPPRTADKKHFGESMAMCVGDLTFFLAMELLNTLSTTSSVKHAIIESVSAELSYVCIAQMQDIALGYENGMPTEQQIISLYRYKTSRYSFSLPFHIGALLANTDTQTIQILIALGEAMGILYQLRDDELNESSLAITGKSAGSDVRGHKKTYKAVYGSPAAQIQSLTKKCVAYIHAVPLDESHKQTLKDILDFICIRTS